MNLFATVLTYPAPTANYRGESELNRTVIQKITDGRFDYPIISPEAMRNALRKAVGDFADDFGYDLDEEGHPLEDREVGETSRQQEGIRSSSEGNGAGG